MSQTFRSHARRQEQGQTIVLVAVTVVTLLAMAALAIDVVTLYVARGEMQRAADAAALAGAKAFADSGVTSDPTNTNLQTLAQNMATAVVGSILQQNKVGGVQPSLAGAPAFDFTRPGNPQISVTVQRTDLPTFFARIWGRRLNTVTASATAEAYNPASSQTSTGNYVPIKPKCVKPLLVTNQDPNRGNATFVTAGTGAVAPGLIGEPLTLHPACTAGGPGTCSPGKLPSNPPNNPPGQGTYLAAAVTPNPANLCPSCQGAADYEQSIECCDFQQYSCGGATANANVDITIRHSQFRQDSSNGVQCLIGKPSQDTVDVTDLLAGTGPARITAQSGPQSGNLVTTSNSVANLPIVDVSPGKPIPLTGQVTVIGFLQVFIDDVVTTGGNTNLQTHVLNVVGCGNNPSATTVLAGSTSPVPVRLIHQ